MNIVMLAGYVPQEPELRHTNSGQAMLKFSVKTSERYMDSQRQWQTEVTFHDCVAWGPRGESLSAHLRKGLFVVVHGAIAKRAYTDRDGNKRQSVDVKVHEVKFPVQHDEPRQQQEFVPPQQQQGAGAADFDDIPFSPLRLLQN